MISTLKLFTNLGKASLKAVRTDLRRPGSSLRWAMQERQSSCVNWRSSRRCTKDILHNVMAATRCVAFVFHFPEICRAPCIMWSE